jgi:hypothetical protein
MNSENDYLWDKTGEPDPEIQQLEEVLGTLRYQPRPLEIPAGLRVGRERNFFRSSTPRLAIAATIAMLLLGLGLWLGLQRLQRRQSPEVAKVPNTRSVTPKPVAVPALIPEPDHNVAVSRVPNQKRMEGPSRYKFNRSLLAENTNRAQARRAAIKNQQLSAQEQQEAEAAKDQLMLAFRVASAKLTLAQRKTQTYPRDLIHNQHRIG